MNIVIEGPDNSGKSTMAAALAQFLDRKIITSQGREKYPGEINERLVNVYRQYEDVIFDRHPAISQPIYANYVGTTMPDERLVEQFYSTKPLIIYCAPSPDLSSHQVKAHDSPEHLEAIHRFHDAICREYNDWAIDYADLIYRRDTPRPLARLNALGAYLKTLEGVEHV